MLASVQRQESSSSGISIRLEAVNMVSPEHGLRPIEKILGDPKTPANGGSFASWIGQELHFLVAVVQDDKDIS